MKNHGNTTYSDNQQITVTINKNDTTEMQIDTLIHEWGHVLEFDTWKAHGRKWATGMGKAYETWEEFNCSNINTQ